MASETVVPEQSTTKEQHVDNKVNEEIKAVDHETTLKSDENGGADAEADHKTEELANPEASITKLDNKKEDEQVDMPADVADENSLVLDIPTVAVPKETDSVNVSDVSIPVVEPVTKAPEEHIKVSGVPVPEADTMEKPIEVVPRIPASEEVMNPVAEVQEVNRPVEVVPPTPAPEEVIALVEEAKEVDKQVEVTVPLIAAPQDIIPPTAEAKEEGGKPVEAVSLIPIPEEVLAPVAENNELVGKPVKVVPLPTPEAVIAPVTEDEAVEVVASTPAPEELIAPIEAVAVDNPIEQVLPTSDSKEVSESEAKIVEQSESSVSLEEKTPEYEITPELIAPMGDEDAKDGEFLVKKAEEVSSTNVDTIVSTNQEAPFDPIDGQFPIILDVAERVGVVDPNEEEISGDVVEGSGRDATLEVGNVETEKLDKLEKKDEVEELKTPETTKTGETRNLITPTEVTEHASRDLELLPEEKLEESVVDDVEPPVEASKDRDINEKEERATDVTTAIEPVAIPKEFVLEEKAKDTVVDKLENAVAGPVEDMSKSDAPTSMESSKDVADSKTGGEVPKEEVPVKTTQKHSNNIMSKVKKSIVKVKKAIIGKSPSSKTISSNAKDDIQVK